MNAPMSSAYTGHQWRDKDRGDSLTRIGDAARAHDAGNRARETRQQGNERAAGQADLDHHPIEQEGCAWQIARFLQHEDEEEQHQNLGQEAEYRAQATEEAVDDQTSQRTVGQPGADLLAQPAEAVADGIRHGFADEVHRLEYQEHHGSEHDHAEHRMQRDAVQAFVDAVGHRGRTHRRRHDPTDFGVKIAAREIGHCNAACACVARTAISGEVVERLDQRAYAGADNRHRFHDGNAQLARERGHIDFDAASTGSVHHVQGQYGGATQRQHFEHEAQMQAQVRGVDHAHDHLGNRFARIGAVQDVVRDLLVETGGREAVGAGQVEHADRCARGRDERAFLALDGDAGIVGDLLARAGQAIEECGLAAVGVADEGDAERGGWHAVHPSRT